MHNCLLCKAKEGKNLKFDLGLTEHYSYHLYDRGLLASVLDPGEGNRDKEGKALDEYGRKFRYKCQVPGCHHCNKSNCLGTMHCPKAIGFKEWALHTATSHHLLEKVLKVEAKTNPALKEVLAKVSKVREAQGVFVLDNMPQPIREELHNCLICGVNMSLDPSKLKTVRHHYAKCYFDRGVFANLGGPYLPGEHNRNEDGSVRDLLGRNVKYRCPEEAVYRCHKGRRVGYKELCIHMASSHGGLERVMRKDKREEIRALVGKI